MTDPDDPGSAPLLLGIARSIRVATGFDGRVRHARRECLGSEAPGNYSYAGSKILRTGSD